jgi:hypothetical protein
VGFKIQEEKVMPRKKKADFSLEKKKGLHGWFARNNGKGWIDCKTGKPCGRKSASDKGRKYPACRPTKSMCTAKGVRAKKSGKQVRWE